MTIEKHLKSECSMIFFNKHVQKPGQTAKALMRSLYELAQHCKFGVSKNEHIRDRIVICIQDHEVSQELQLEAELTLEKAIQLARQSEQVKKQSTDRRADSTVNAVRHKAQQPPGGKGSNVRQRWQNSPKRGESKQDTCSRCNRNHGKGDLCPAHNRRCRKCNKMGL